MRYFGPALAVWVILLGTQRASAHTATFDLSACNLNATDIVVADPDGRVLETWRGELKPGDLVRLGPMRLTPTNALPWDYLRLRPNRTLSGLYHRGPGLEAHRGYIEGDNLPPAVIVWPAVPEVAETTLRLVLFLRKEGTTGLGAIWMPAAAPPSPSVNLGCIYGGREAHAAAALTAVRHPIGVDADFTASMAWVEAGRILTLQESPVVARRWSSPDQEGLLAPIAIGLSQFKANVLALSRPLTTPTVDYRLRYW